MPEDWPLNLWGFAKLIAPHRCRAYLAWHDVGTTAPLSQAAERRIRHETLRREPKAEECNWSLYSDSALRDRVWRLRENAKHLIKTVLPSHVRSALRTGRYKVTGVGSDGRRTEINDDDLAGLDIDLERNCLIGPTIAFERISVRPRGAGGELEQAHAPPPLASRIASAPLSPVQVVPEGMIGLRDAVEETVQALFGDEFVADLTEHDLKAAAAGDDTRARPWQRSTEQLLAALKSGRLVGFAVRAVKGQRVPLPRTYWSQWIAEWRPFLSGRVEVLATAGDRVPGELRDIAGWPCAIHASVFRIWLAGCEKARIGREPLGNGETLLDWALDKESDARQNAQPLPWLPVSEAVSKAAEAKGLSVEASRRTIEKAIETGHLPIRGLPIQHDHASDSLPQVIRIPATPRRRSARGENGSVINWHNGASQPSLTIRDSSEASTYTGLEIECDEFDAWLFLAKPGRAAKKLPDRYVGMPEALARLRRHIKAAENRVALDDELALLVAEHARQGRLKVFWMDDSGHAISISPSSWEAGQLPKSAPAERLVLNGAVKGRSLVFVRREFTIWLGDRPEEADPPPRKLEQRDAAPIPLIAREWSREPGPSRKRRSPEGSGAPISMASSDCRQWKAPLPTSTGNLSRQ